jgi:RNA polymerase sigma-70 factor, ECF subfamily
VDRAGEQEQQIADDERNLLAAAQAGDVPSFETLVERYRDRVFGLAMRMTRSEADAAEITQDAFLAAFQNLESFRGDASFGSWVHRIAANYALMRLRRSKVRASAEEEITGPEFNERGSLIDYPESDWSRRADEKALDHELRQAIDQATEKLPEDYRQVFLLKDVDGLSYEEIAEITGDSVPAIKSRLHRARLALREAIDRFYNAKPT